jgi:hypothetical protein
MSAPTVHLGSTFPTLKLCSCFDILSRGCVRGFSSTSSFVLTRLFVPRVAVATVWDGVNATRFSCALPLWCRAAQRLSSAVSSTSTPIILGTSSCSADCPQARCVWPNATVDAILRYSVARRSKGNLINLLKVHLFALTEFDAVLYTDLDVDASPPGEPPSAKWLRWWHEGMGIFMRSAALVVATADHEAPINTASLLLKPDLAIYHAALTLFHNLTFTPQRGFNSIGKPRELMDSPHFLDDHKLALLGVGLGEAQSNQSRAIDNVRKRLQRTAAYRNDRWSFAAGSIDQGFFLPLMLTTRTPIVTWAERNCRCSRRRWAVQHYWGPNKPWRPVAADSRVGATVRYLRSLWLPNGTSRGVSQNGSAAHSAAPPPGLALTPCLVALSTLRARIEAKGLWTDEVASRGRRTVNKQTVLPSTLLRNFTFSV